MDEQWGLIAMGCYSLDSIWPCLSSDDLDH